MSKTSLAPRVRSTKAAKVVPIRPLWGPVDNARADFESQSETTSTHLKGLHMLLDAWMDYESRGGHVSPDARDAALGFLGAAATEMGKQLEAKREAWREAERAAAKKSA